MLESAWLRVAVTLASLRANRAHPFRNSVLALLPTLAALALPNLVLPAVAAAVRARSLNADRFLDSRFAREQLQQSNAAAAAAATSSAGGIAAGAAAAPASR